MFNHTVRIMTRQCQAMAALSLLLIAVDVRGQAAFPQGVASGDVRVDSAVVWTRMPGGGAARLDIATDPNFDQVVQSVTVNAGADSDFALKQDVTGLEPATLYYYRWLQSATGEVSDTGRFRTAPAADAATTFRFVYSGDSNAADQPFRVLNFAADERPDVWFWAGDTIYGDVPAGGLGVAMTRSDYQAKHRQNREDAALRRLLAESPVYTQWDDHEVANDYDGADLEAHISADRAALGQQAFFDYMPIRPQGIVDDPRRIYRSVRYGSLAEFFILDCRQYRSADLSRSGGGPDPRAFFIPIPQFDIIARLQDGSRTMLGKPQLAWLKNGLKASTARWKFVLSSVPLTSLLVLPYDRWDGYEAERYELLRFIDSEAITGVVVLSADIHANLYNPDLTRFQRDRLGAFYSPCFSVPEFVAGPIGTETFLREVRDIGAAVFNTPETEFGNGLFFNSVLGGVALRVAAENKLAFLDMDKFAYLVVDVRPGGLTVSHKGVLPDYRSVDAPLATLNSVTLTGASTQPGCGAGLGLPICLMTGMSVFGVHRMKRARAGEATAGEREKRGMP